MRTGLGGCDGVFGVRVGAGGGAPAGLLDDVDAGAALSPLAPLLEEVGGAAEPEDASAAHVAVASCTEVDDTVLLGAAAVVCCPADSSGCVRSISVGPLRGITSAGPARAEPGLLVALAGLAGDGLLNLAWKDWKGDLAEARTTLLVLAGGASST